MIMSCIVVIKDFLLSHSPMYCFVVSVNKNLKQNTLAVKKVTAKNKKVWIKRNEIKMDGPRPV